MQKNEFVYGGPQLILLLGGLVCYRKGNAGQLVAIMCSEGYHPLAQTDSGDHNSISVITIYDGKPLHSENNYWYKIYSKLLASSVYGHKMIVGVVYRLPNSEVAHFYDTIHDILEKVANRPCYIMGDFNLDLLKHELHRPTEKYLDIVYANSYLPMINLPTRVTPVYRQITSLQMTTASMMVFSMESLKLTLLIISTCFTSLRVTIIKRIKMMNQNLSES